jgi:[acyl-carrier-protein] S-malonyltransferase
MSCAVGFMFSTFAMRRAEFAVQDIPGFTAHMRPFIDRAAAVVPISPDTFYYLSLGEVPKDLSRTQSLHYASYIEGVAAGAFAERLIGPCQLAAGYSMGIYAALCHLGSLEFEDGLRLMNEVCVAVHNALAHTAYALGAVEGLTVEVVRELLAPHGRDVELIDVYGPTTLVLSGKSDAVAAVIEAAQKAGAVFVRHMPATAPYHTAALQAAEPQIRGFLEATRVEKPRASLLSALNQQSLVTADDIREELARNVLQPMHWLDTTRAMIASGIATLCECGSSASLGNMARREVPGQYEVADLRALAAAAAR